jgi:hypothetical protein
VLVSLQDDLLVSDVLIPVEDEVCFSVELMTVVEVETAAEVVVEVQTLVDWVVTGEVVVVPVLMDTQVLVVVPEVVTVVVLVVMTDLLVLGSCVEEELDLVSTADELVSDLDVGTVTVVALVEVEVQMLVLDVMTGEVVDCPLVSVPVLDDVQIEVEVPVDVKVVVLIDVLLSDLEVGTVTIVELVEVEVQTLVLDVTTGDVVDWPLVSVPVIKDVQLDVEVPVEVTTVVLTDVLGEVCGPLLVSDVLGETGTVVSFVVVEVNPLVEAVVTGEVVKLPLVPVPVLIDTQVAVEVPDVVTVVVLTVEAFEVSVFFEVDTAVEVAVEDV